jgi:hypothetical protein
MKKFTMLTLVAGALAVGMWGVVSAQDSDPGGASDQHDARSCKLKTLRGSYLFAANGFNIVGGVAQPKAIHEVIEFNGDGSLTVPAVTLSVNGMVSHPPAGVGDYTLEANCRGTLVFSGGPSFDIVVASNGKTVWMFQTNPNTVFQGTATLFDH